MPSPSEIRSARTQAGLTQAQAGKLLGVTRQAWARYELTGASNRPLSEQQWEYWCHAAGIERMPFKARSKSK